MNRFIVNWLYTKSFDYMYRGIWSQSVYPPGSYGAECGILYIKMSNLYADLAKAIEKNRGNYRITRDENIADKNHGKIDNHSEEG